MGKHAQLSMPASWALLSLNPSPGNPLYTAGRTGLTHTIALSVCKQDRSVFWTEIASACSIIWGEKNKTKPAGQKCHRCPVEQAPSQEAANGQGSSFLPAASQLCLLSATAKCRLRADCHKDSEAAAVTNGWNNRLLFTSSGLKKKKEKWSLFLSAVQGFESWASQTAMILRKKEDGKKTALIKKSF